MRSVRSAPPLLFALAACSGGEPPAPTAEAPPAASTEVRFVAHDHAFEGPDTVSAGMTRLVLANEGRTWHHLQLIKLEDGMTVEDFQAALARMQPGTPPPSWLIEAGGVNPPEPGKEAATTLMLEPGRYAVVCFVDTPDRVPHVMRGMIAALTVVDSGRPSAPAPDSDLTVTLVDYGFSFSQEPTAGRHTVRVINSGPQAHEIALFKLLPGKTMEDMVTWARTYEGAAPMTAEGGVPGIEPGQEARFDVELTPGQWVALCFVPDEHDGAAHLAHGMAMPFLVS
ncbi:MAG: hypothetical protein R3E98_20050 [Gemmatimonadota bacterium]|nr:hypothetical protein [Gemmatimonadota bacterium]